PELPLPGRLRAYPPGRRELAGRLAAGQGVTAELAVAARLVGEAAATTAAAARRLAAWPARLRGAPDAAAAAALDPALARLMATHDPRPHAAGSDPLPVWVDPPLGRCSAWYELFPRSLGGDRHGTLADVEGVLARIAGTGFDRVSPPPGHPVGET